MKRAGIVNPPIDSWHQRVNDLSTHDKVMRPGEPDEV